MGNLMGKQTDSPWVGQPASRFSHLPPKGEVGKVQGSPGNSHFPMNSLPIGNGNGKKGKEAVHCMSDLRRSMAAARTRKTAKTILTAAQNRLEDVRFIGWPALEQSLQDELDDCRAIAAERGLLGVAT